MASKAKTEARLSLPGSPKCQIWRLNFRGCEAVALMTSEVKTRARFGFARPDYLMGLRLKSAS